jgi:hypothetical protein
VGVFVFLINDHPKLKCPHTYYHIPVALDAAVVLRARERPTPVAVIACNGPSSSPPIGSRASSADHIWIKLLRPPFVVVVVLFHPRMRNLDDGTDDGTNGWKG